MEQLYAAVESGSLEDAFQAAYQTQNKQTMLIADIEQSQVTAMRFSFGCHYARLVSLEHGVFHTVTESLKPRAERKNCYCPNKIAARTMKRSKIQKELLWGHK